MIIIKVVTISKYTTMAFSLGKFKVTTPTFKI